MWIQSSREQCARIRTAGARPEVVCGLLAEGHTVSGAAIGQVTMGMPTFASFVTARVRGPG
jgi:hypothetical protein